MSNNLKFLLPTYTRTESKKPDEIDYNRFHHLPVNPVDPLHIIFPEHERGGMDTRQYVKSINGTPLEYTVRTPFWHNITESLTIKSEYFITIGKLDSPQITYDNLLKKN